MRSTETETNRTVSFVWSLQLIEIESNKPPLADLFHPLILIYSQIGLPAAKQDDRLSGRTS